MDINQIPPSFKLSYTLQSGSSRISRIMWSPDGRMIASTAQNSEIQIWNADTGKFCINLQSLSEEFNCVAWSPNGKLLAAGSEDGKVYLWDVQSWNLLCTIRGLTGDMIWNLGWSPDDQLLAVSSGDHSIYLLDSKGNIRQRIMAGNLGSVLALAWSPNGQTLALGSKNGSVYLWDRDSSQIFQTLKGHSDWLLCLAWSPDGGMLASSSRDTTIRFWNPKGGWQHSILEGHTSAVNCISFSKNGQFLASKAIDGVRVWRCYVWEIAATLNEKAPADWLSDLAFHPQELVLATLGRNNRMIRIWKLDASLLSSSKSEVSSVQYVNAKVILVGESGVGKSGLGIRISEKEFRLTESTHGAKFWQLPVPEDLALINSELKVKAELTLWDLAGQPEYHLVHQLFLDDTDVALILVDCSDSTHPFRGASYWIKVLNKQAPPSALKYLVFSRCDVSPITVTQQEIYQVLSAKNLHGYFRTSAKTGEGVEELLKELIKCIPWNKLPRTTTPKLFQVIREYLLSLKESGEILISLENFKQEVLKRYNEHLPTQAEIDTAVGLIQARGFVYRLAPTPSLPLILLKPELINQYASSIIKATRDHLNGVGAILERDVVCANLSLEEIAVEERLPSDVEKIILESTVELFIRHNLGFREMGYLIFPSQLNTSYQFLPSEYPPTEITYEFSGSVEAIYASLVVCLSYTHDFQREKLWKYAAEFSKQGNRLGFTMQQIDEGTGELEIYFYPGISDFDRVTFIRFIRNHLYTKGIDLQERIRLYCPNSECRKEVTNREAIELRVKAGKLEIPCQYCDTAVLIPHSIEEKYSSDRAYHEKQKELQAIVERRTKQEIQAFRQDHRQYMAASDQLIRILHLSDLHLETVEQAQQYFTQLATDLTQNLQVKQLSYLVISGDIANSSTQGEYEAAFDFTDSLVKRYGLNPSRVVVVPGNHDLNWDLSESAYTFVPQRKLPNPLPKERYILAGDAGALICDDTKYQQRFVYFSEHFYKKVYGRSFPTDYSQQAILHPCPQDKILFLALNSCWNIDHEYRDRAGIHPNAIANALDQILVGDYDDWLKIAVWHHSVTSAESMKDVAFLEQLAVHGFQIGMHGHIHEAKDETFQYDTNRGLRIIAAGTFEAPTKEQVTGIPLQYNLLTLNPDSGELTVETRKKEKVDGAWSADARWGDKNNPVPRYVIPLRYSPNNAIGGTSKDSTTTNNENNASRPQQSIFNNVRVGGNLTTGDITQSYNSETRSFPAQSAQPSSSKRTILILAASPTDQGRLNLGIEVRNIDEGLRLSPQRDQFELKQSWAVRVDDLRRALLDFNPEIVHFCGHGLGTGGLAFENSSGQTHFVSTDALAGLFQLFSNQVRCVVLNACYSEVQAKAIVEHIDFVVGMKAAIGQEASTRFSVGFYDAVVRGRSIKDAHAFGCNAIAEYNIPEDDIPALLEK